MSLTFSKLTPAYQKEFDKILSKTKYETSDYCLASVLFFTELDDIQIAKDDIALYIKSIYNDEVVFFSPLCEEKNFCKAINIIKEYCLENDIVLKFYATKNNVELLLKNEGLNDNQIIEILDKKEFKTNNFCFENDRNSADYIFKPKNLIELAGSDYKSKRNEINAFEKKYSGRYEIRDMKEEDIDGILSLVKIWHKFKEFSQNDEAERLKEILQQQEQLHINVVVLVVDNEIVATSIYSITKSNIGDEIFERCKPEFRNAYALIARYVATKLRDCDYINFEEDMGLEGLRFSKMSYKPEYLLEKFIITENLDSELKQIYQNIFGDNDEFTKEIFSEHCQCTCSSLDLFNKKVVACGFYRMKNLKILDKIYPLPFLFAIGTDENFRYQGRAKKIVTRLLNMINDKNIGIAALYPFPVSRKFYEKMGFVTFNYTREVSLKDILLANTEFRLESNPDPKIFTDVFNNSCQEFNITQYRNEKDTEKMLSEAKAFDGKILSFYFDNICYGYILKSEEEVEEVIVDITFVKNHNKNTTFDFKNCEENIKKFLDEKVLLCSNKPVKKQADDDEGYQPYIMIRPVDSYRFVKMFLPFIDTSKDMSINIMVEDNKVGNSIINLCVFNNVAYAHSCPDEETKNYTTISSADLCHWALGELEIDALPKIDSDKITTKYKDTY